MLFVVEDLKDGSVLALSPVLPKVRQVIDLAIKRKRHVAVTFHNIKLFDSVWYLQEAAI